MYNSCFFFPALLASRRSLLYGRLNAISEIHSAKLLPTTNLRPLDSFLGPPLFQDLPHLDNAARHLLTLRRLDVAFRIIFSVTRHKDEKRGVSSIHLKAFVGCGAF
jgi:hypothetical protein